MSDAHLWQRLAADAEYCDVVWWQERRKAVDDAEQLKARATERAQQQAEEYKQKVIIRCRSRMVDFHDHTCSSISSVWIEQLSECTAEVRKLRESYVEKLKLLEEQQRASQAQLNASSREAAVELAEQRRRHERELEQAIHEANERYNQMLLEQLRAQNELQERLEAQMKNAVAEAEQAGRQLAEQKVGQARAELAGEKQEAIMATRREYEEKLKVCAIVDGLTVNRRPTIYAKRILFVDRSNVKKQVQNCSARWTR